MDLGAGLLALGVIPAARLRRGQPAGHDDQGAARVVAQVMVRQAVSALVTMGFALNLAGLALHTASPWWVGLLAVVALAALIGQVVSSGSERVE